jgi:hypothetical protein
MKKIVTMMSIVLCGNAFAAFEITASSGSCSADGTFKTARIKGQLRADQTCQNMGFNSAIRVSSFQESSKGVTLSCRIYPGREDVFIYRAYSTAIYECAEKISKITGNIEGNASGENFKSNMKLEFSESTDVFTSYGESTSSSEDARDSVDRQADNHCSSLGYHYYADRVSAYIDGSFIAYRCNPIYRPGCRDTYKFISEAKFKCESAGW